MSKKENNNVTVGVRVRPRNQKEIEAEMPLYFTTSADGGTVQELDENGVVVKHWSYDHVFGPDCTNMDIFQTMGLKLVDAAMEGYNTVMFMYGQTSSGKTFTLFGGNGVAGVVQHAMEHVYHRVKTSIDMEYVIKLTYAELYNEEIKDLLSPTPNENLKIIEDPNIGPLIQNITEASFTSAADVKLLLEEGENRRHFGVTNMNAHSSRSHVIVRLHIESRKVQFKLTSALRTNWGKDKPHCVSTLNLVDLAGSERANKAGTSGQSLKEGSFINKSLLTLGTVISNLSEGKTQHIPYRNSKLTRLLATALGGNAKTSVITCISPASGNVGESLNTLRFASRAKRIVNQVQKNEILDMRSLTNKLTHQLQEIEHLRHQLELSRQLGFCPDDAEAGDTLREKAVVISKTLRGMKFLIKDGSKVINGLRGQGMSHLAKKVQQEIKHAINGERDMASVIDEFVTVVETYLSKDRRLLEKVQNIALQNESESIMNIQDGMVLEDLGLMEDSDDSETFFDILMSGGEEMKELNESKSMAHEELRVTACNRITKLEKSISECSAREKMLRKSLDESQHALVEQHENARLIKNSEMVLHKQIDDLKLQKKHEMQAHAEQLKQLNARINDMQVKMDEREEKLTEKLKEIISKESENERLRNQVEQLIKDLNSAIASKKAFEEESSRARSEMRIQMDKLRNNMHEMLLQGGMEAKVIESQNAELQKEVDILRDEKECLCKTKENLELELQQLQAALAASRDSEKSQQNELTTLKNENTDQTQKIRELRLKMAKLAVSLSFNDELNKTLQNQIKTEVKLREETLEAKSKEIEILKEKARSKVNEMQVELDIKDAEVESLRDQLNQKLLFVAKMEQSYGSDVARLEKKLAVQSRLCEELSVENHHAALQAQVALQKHNEDVKILKQKIQEQQAAFDTINSYVEQQHLEHSEERYEENETRISLISNGGSYGGEYSPNSRADSMISSYYPAITMVGDGDELSVTSIVNTPLERANFKMSDMQITTDDMQSHLPHHDIKRSGLSVSIDLNQNTVNDTIDSLSAMNTINTPVPSQSISSTPATTLRSKHNHAENGEFSVRDTNFDQLHIDQSYYDQLLYSLTLATNIMEFNLQQERQLRSFFIKSEYGYLEKMNAQQYQLEKLVESEKSLQDMQTQLHDSLRFHQLSQSTLQQRHSELETKYNEHMKEFYKLNKQEKVGNIHSQSLETVIREQKVLLEKFKTDLSRQELESQDLRLRHMETEGQLEHNKEQYKLLQTLFEVIQQEKSILHKEKEELSRRCSYLIAQNNRYHFQQTTPYRIDGESAFNDNVDKSFAEEETKEFILKTPGEESHQSNCDISSIIGKYRNARTTELRAPSISLKLSDSIGSRITQSETVNTLRTYAMNTGSPLTFQNHPDGSIYATQKDVQDKAFNGSGKFYPSPLKRR